MLILAGTVILSTLEKNNFLVQRIDHHNSRDSSRRKFLIKLLKSWGKNLSMSKFSEDAWAPIKIYFSSGPVPTNNRLKILR